ncbi:MAG: dynamin family protein [Cyanobacteria bacterium P01_G01_bin.39]
MPHTVEKANQATANFSVQINEIINKRKDLAQKVQHAKNNVDKLLQYLLELKGKKVDALSALKDQQTKERLNCIDFESLIVQLKKEQIQLEKLLTRFARETINIAVVGKAGQGKSTLLQTLTGLDDAIIPSSKNDHCTAVRSKISNHLNDETSKQFEIIFHDQKSFFEEVIFPYYSTLELKGNKPNDLENFIANPLAQLIHENKSNQTIYEHLEKYHKKLNDNPNLFLDNDQKLAINESKLRNYIAQNQNNNLEYLTVKEIDIKCVFPRAKEMGIEKLSFIDMPGSGDGKSHNSANLLQTLGKDIDFVLFVYKPSAQFREEAEKNANLQDLFHNSQRKDAISNLPINQWSFYVVNYHPSSDPEHDNRESCDKFKNIIQQKGYVADTVIANCKNEKETTSNILAAVLKYLAQELNNLDEQYASKCQISLKEFHNILQEKLNQASIYGIQASSDSFGDLTTRYTDLFNNRFKELKIELIKLAKDLDSRKNNKNQQIEKFIDTAIKDSDADKLLPSLEEIKTEIDIDGYLYVHNQYLKRLKADILTPFNDIDECFIESLTDTKKEVVGILVEVGGLDKTIKNYNENYDFKTKVNFFSDLLQAIPNHWKVEKLRQAIENIHKFTINYRAEIEGIIREKNNIKHLIPEQTTHTVKTLSRELEEKVNPKKFQENVPKYTRDALIAAHTAVIKNSEIKLRKLSEDPNKKLVEMIRTFIDEAFEAEGVKDDWRKFLSYYLVEIWSDEFGSDANDTKLKQEWMKIVEDTKQVNNSDVLSFLS